MELNKNDLVFAKVKENAIIPSKTEENAGYDIYACFEEDYIIIPANTTKLIPTGIASAMSNNYYIQIEERGSTGSKGIKKSAGVIDSGYRGEWFIAITNSNMKDLIISKLSMEELACKYGENDNYNDEAFGSSNRYIDGDTYCVYLDEDCTIIYPYEKAIAQAVVHEVPKMNVSEVSYADLQTIKSERGNGALGSSKK